MCTNLGNRICTGIGNPVANGCIIAGLGMNTEVRDPRVPLVGCELQVSGENPGPLRNVDCETYPGDR